MLDEGIDVGTEVLLAESACDLHFRPQCKDGVGDRDEPSSVRRDLLGAAALEHEDLLRFVGRCFDHVAVESVAELVTNDRRQFLRLQEMDEPAV